MRTYGKYIISVIAVSVVSYIRQLIWIDIAEPVLEACGMEFGGIMVFGDCLGALVIILINISGAVALGILYNGSIPIWLCLFYSVLYMVFLLIYCPGRLEYSLSEFFFNSVPFAAFVLEIIPFTVARFKVKRKNKETPI